MQKYFCSLILLQLLVCSPSVIYGGEQSGNEIPRQQIRQPIHRRLSPLAYESTIATEDMESGQEDEIVDEPEEQEAVPKISESPCIGGSMRLRHKVHGYEVVLQRAPISRCRATAVINPYNPDIKLSQASLDLYRTGGQEFVGSLRSLYKKQRDLFAGLKKMPGNSYVLHPEFCPLGNLPMDVMALMYVPRVMTAKKKLSIMGALSSGICYTLLHQLYPLMSHHNIQSASVVLPAIGADPVFEGYPGPLMAKTLLSTVVMTLRYLHGLRHKRLKYVAFMVDSEEAYGHYAEAFNRFYETERNYFIRIESSSGIGLQS